MIQFNASVWYLLPHFGQNQLYQHVALLSSNDLYFPVAPNLLGRVFNISLQANIVWYQGFHW